MQDETSLDPSHTVIGSTERVGILPEPAQIPAELQTKLKTILTAQNILTRERIFVLVEIGLILIWACLFAHPYLDFGPNAFPDGVDYPLQVQFNHVWDWMRQCGLCATWDGSVGGGFPIFADVFPATLHPLTILTTLGWGVRNGSKLEFVGIFFMAGLAQWWLARVIGLRAFARLWSGAMGVVAGNIVGRLQMGWINVALSTAACALVLPPLIQVAVTGSRRAGVLLGVALGLALLSGQGYMQVGLALTFPAVLVLLPWRQPGMRQVLRRYALAAGIAGLIAAPFLVPFLFSFSQFTKAVDIDLRGALHLISIPLSFVISDREFYESGLFGMQQYPALYYNFVGWGPIILLLVGVLRAQGARQIRIVIYLLLAIFLAMFAASLEFRQFLLSTFPNTFLGDLAMELRSAPVIAGLAVPPLLGLSAIGVDKLWKWLSVRIQVGMQTDSQPLSFGVSPRWLFVIPLLWGLLNLRDAGNQWMATVQIRPEVYPVLQKLKTADLQWVYYPQQNVYMDPAIGMGLKIPWIGLSETWKDHKIPDALRKASADPPEAGFSEIGRVENIAIYQAGPENSYATISSDAGSPTICSASGIAGDIDVHCDAQSGGTLTVKENSWAGWGAQVDGNAVALNPDIWLSVNVAAGKHLIQFRYRPLDFPIGVLLFVIGIGLVIFWWFKPDTEPAGVLSL